MDEEPKFITWSIMKSHSDSKHLQSLRKRHTLSPKTKQFAKNNLLQTTINPFNIMCSNFNQNFNTLYNIICDMAIRKLKLDRIMRDDFMFRHCASIYAAGTKWREKAGPWRKFDPGGSFRLLL